MMGNPTFVIAWTSGHGEDVWQWVYDEEKGEDVFVPVPTAFSGSEYFGQDPLGQEVGTYDPGPDDPGDVGGYPEPHEFGNADDPDQGCDLDGISTSCSDLRRWMDAEATAKEYWIYDNHGWHPEQSPIIPLGLGLFGYDRPSVKHDNEGPKISWSAVVAFSFLPQHSGLLRQDAWERKHITSDACGHMADVAQQQANEALQASGNSPAKALSAFHDQFGVIYDGRAMKSAYDEYRLARYGPQGRTINQRYLGETGFKLEFMDTDPENISKHSDADQTHHFASFFSGGINGHSSALLHNLNDNSGDVNLGNAGYDLGADLAAPSREPA